MSSLEIFQCFLCLDVDDMLLPGFTTLTTASCLPIIEKLFEILQEELPGRGVSSYLCKNCFDLVDQYDVFQRQLMDTKLSIENLFRDNQNDRTKNHEKNFVGSLKESETKASEDDQNILLPSSLDDNSDSERLIKDVKDDYRNASNIENGSESCFSFVRKPRKCKKFSKLKENRRCLHLHHSLMEKLMEVPILSEKESLNWDLMKLQSAWGSLEDEDQGDCYSRPGETFCYKCDLEFKSWHLKLVHCLSQVHTTNSMASYQCHICDYSDNHEALAVHHMESVHKIEMKKISIYDKVITKNTNSSKMFVRTCSKCSLQCTSRMALLYHIRRSHTKPHSGHVCFMCGIEFQSECDLKKHCDDSLHASNDPECANDDHTQIKSVSDEDRASIVCPVCSRHYKRLVTLKYHIKKQHPNRDPVLGDECDLSLPECDKCKQTFKTLVVLAKHKGSVHGIIVPVECKDCGLTLISPNALQDHRREQHAANFMCEICQKRLVSQFALDNHRYTVHGLGQQRDSFICEVCCKSFGTIYRLKSHMKLHSTALSALQHECKICQKRFRWSSSLSCHIRAAHDSNTSIFQCEMCSRTFKDKNNLKKHIYTHSDKKPHSCIFCGKGFIRRDLQEKHQRLCRSQDISSSFEAPSTSIGLAGLTAAANSHLAHQLQAAIVSSSGRHFGPNIDQALLTGHITTE